MAHKRWWPLKFEECIVPRLSAWKIAKINERLYVMFDEEDNEYIVTDNVQPYTYQGDALIGFHDDPLFVRCWITEYLRDASHGETPGDWKVRRYKETHPER